MDGRGRALDNIFVDRLWRSVKYEEVTFDWGGVTIIDARGQLPNGNRWRYLGMFGESASYSDMDEATAKILDRFLDGPQRWITARSLLGFRIRARWMATQQTEEHGRPDRGAGFFVHTLSRLRVATT